MKKKAKHPKAPGKVAHFSWPDLLVLAGAAILVPVSVYERRWFFLVIGLSIAAAIGIRVMITRALAGRALAGRALAGRALAGSEEASGKPGTVEGGRDPDGQKESMPVEPVAPVAAAAPTESHEPPQSPGRRQGRP